MTLPLDSKLSTEVSNQFALDTKALGNLKLAAKENSPEAIRGVAKQFEAIFVTMMLKSMREATHSEGLFDNEASKMYTSMFDQQISQKIASGKGIGLADMLTRQLSKASGVTNPMDSASMQSALKRNGLLGSIDGNAEIDHVHAGSDKLFSSMLEADLGNVSLAAQNSSNRYTDAYQKIGKLYHSGDRNIKSANDISSAAADSGWMEKIYQLKNGVLDSASEIVSSISKNIKDSSSQFVDKFASYAQEVSKVTGLPANYMLGQAALETGWGKKEIKGADGTPSFNLFGIKATPGWTGKVVNTRTTEYIDGVMQSSIEKFRAYDSYEDSFKDFAGMISSSSRFKGVMNQLGAASTYANAIANSGYATDPNYAKKLFKVIDQVSKINK